VPLFQLPRLDLEYPFGKVHQSRGGDLVNRPIFFLFIEKDLQIVGK
jgi:hypothetical protein